MSSVLTYDLCKMSKEEKTMQSRITTQYEPTELPTEEIRTFSRSDASGDPLAVTTHQFSKGHTWNLGGYRSLRATVSLVCGVRQPTDVRSTYDKGTHIVRIREMVNETLTAIKFAVKSNLGNLSLGNYLILDRYEEGALGLPIIDDLFDPIYIKKIHIDVSMKVPTQKAYSPVEAGISTWFDIVGDIRDPVTTHQMVDELVSWSVSNVFEELWRANGGRPLPNASFDLPIFRGEEVVRPTSLGIKYGRLFDTGNFESFGAECNLWSGPIYKDSEGRPQGVDVDSWVSRVRKMARENVKKQYLDFLERDELVFIGLMPPGSGPEEIFIKTAGVCLNAKLNLGDFESKRVSISDWADLVDAAEMHRDLGESWQEHPLALVNHGGEHIALTRLWESQWRNFNAELYFEANKHQANLFGIPVMPVEKVDESLEDDDKIEGQEELEDELIEGKYTELSNTFANEVVAVLTS
jgi:hypothetical protein